jgi:hypothetical protein
MIESLVGLLIPILRALRVRANPDAVKRKTEAAFGVEKGRGFGFSPSRLGVTIGLGMEGGPTALTHHLGTVPAVDSLFNRTGTPLDNESGA